MTTKAEHVKKRYLYPKWSIMNSASDAPKADDIVAEKLYCPIPSISLSSGM